MLCLQRRKVDPEYAILLFGWETQAVARDLQLLAPHQDLSASTSPDMLHTIRAVMAKGGKPIVAFPEPQVGPALDHSRLSSLPALAIMTASPLVEVVRKAAGPAATVCNVARYLVHFRASPQRSARTVMQVSQRELQWLTRTIASRAASLGGSSDPHEVQLCRDLQFLENLLPRALGFEAVGQRRAFLEPRGEFNLVISPAMTAHAGRRILALGSAKSPELVLSSAAASEGADQLSTQLFQLHGPSQGLGLPTTNALNTPPRYHWSETTLKPPFTALVNSLTNEEVQGIVGLKQPLRYENDVNQYFKLKKEKNFFIGVCSYLDWPGDLENPQELQSYRYLFAGARIVYYGRVETCGLGLWGWRDRQQHRVAPTGILGLPDDVRDNGLHYSAAGSLGMGGNWLAGVGGGARSSPPKGGGGGLGKGLS